MLEADPNFKRVTFIKAHKNPHLLLQVAGGGSKNTV